MDGRLIFDTKIDQSGFKNDAGQLKSLAGKVVAGVGLMLSAGAIAKGLVSVGKQGVETASNLQEVQNVVDVTFGSGAEQVDSWAKSAQKSFGLSELAAKQYSGTIGAMLKSMGLADAEVLTMSTSITELAADFASFYNITSEDAFAKIRSGLSGETEPLKQLGINMSVANLEAYALSQGLDKTYASMTQAEQAALRYNYLLSVSADAQGDFARTSDSYANASRIASMEVERVSTSLGSRLLPAVTKVTVAAGDMAGELADAMDSGGMEGGIDYIQTQFPLATAAVTGLAVSYGALGVIKTVTKLTQSFQTAQVQVNLASKAGRLATLAETGALTVKEHIVGVLTGKLSALTVAQRIFNITLAANPVTLLVAGLGLFVGAVTLADRAAVKYNSTMRENEKDALELKTRVEELSDTIKSSAESYQKTRRDIEDNAVSAGGLIDKLEEMSAAYTGTSTEQELMRALCGELNSSVEGLNVSFNAQTGELSMTAAAMREYADAAAATAQKKAAVDRYVAALNNVSEAEYNAKSAEKAYSDMLRDSSELTIKAQHNIRKAYNESRSALENANAELADSADYLDYVGESVEDATGKVEAGTAALEAAADETERVVIAGYDLTDVLEKTGVSADEASKRFDSYAEAAQNMFDLISTESELSVGDMISNLDANAKAVEDYGSNLNRIAGQIPDDLYTALAGDPEKFAGVVAELAAASPDDLASLSKSWAGAGEAASDALLDSLGAVEADADQLPTTKVAEQMESDTSMETAGKEAVAKTETAMSNQVTTSNFGLIGENVVRGLTDGMNNKRGELYQAGRTIVRELLATMKSTAQEQSPSKITTLYGENLTLGWANGIRNKLGIAREAARQTVDASLSELRSGAYPLTMTGTQQATLAQQTGAGGRVVNVTQQIYAEKQSPAEMLREARWQQERAVLTGA